MYLPTADMDLVILSPSFIHDGIKTLGTKNSIHAFARFIGSQNIAIRSSIEPIVHAKVPILKFTDRLTGLRVDLSFDNESGLVTKTTCERWKDEFPDMPVIVSIIKQFLLLRGLNEVPTGGLGGLSITCLVISMLQHLPHGHVERNLATILMNFFYFYGNFSYDTFGIRLDPPGYFDKVGATLRKTLDVRLKANTP